MGSLALWAYWLATWLLHPFLPVLLKRRLERGKEDPSRWREKLGVPGLERPQGRLIWLHAVGLGETLALRGLVAQLAEDRHDQEYLITSGTRSSAEVLARNLPDKCRHQFLPLDTPQAAKRFLDHWLPDVAIWAEQEIWPGLIAATHRRGIPLALVNARMDEGSFRKRQRASRLFADTLRRFTVISAQEEVTAGHLKQLGAKVPVRLDGSLKPSAPPLDYDAAELEQLREMIDGQPCWLAASTHPEDEALVLTARESLSDHICVLVPRDPERAAEIVAGSERVVLLSEVTGRTKPGQVLVDDRFGTLGCWYRLCPVALIGGTFGSVEGHNPWEAVLLESAVIHGPRTANFASDYRELKEAGASLEAINADELSAAVRALDRAARVAAAQEIVALHRQKIAALAGVLNGL